MNAVVVALASCAVFLLAYRFYGGFIVRQVLGVDPARPVPAVTRCDGNDFVPTNRFVLFGHHFASIAGLGPILGPAIAVIWGWVPALLWVVFGSILIGAVHDTAALLVSVRSDGRSIGDVCRELLGPRGRLLFLLIIFFTLALAMGVFVLVLAQIFSPDAAGAATASAGIDASEFRSSYPETVIPSLGLILVAVLMGLAVYRWKISLHLATVGGLALMAGLLAAGVSWPEAPSQAAAFLGLAPTKAQWLAGWTWALLAYGLLASVLPVWLLLQPRDYLNSFQLYAGMGLILAGLLAGAPVIAAPAFNPAVSAPGTDIPAALPLLMITVACGAASGFHNLVASGTTARQLASEADIRFVGYGAMLLEGMLAVLVILACTAGFSSAEDWSRHYASWNRLEGGALGLKLSAFVHGAGGFMINVGVPLAVGRTLVAVVVVGFALTTLDSATRLLRYNVEELGASLGIRLLRNAWVASLVAVAAIGFFAFLKVGGKPVGLTLWALFGTTNQLLVGLGLLVATLFLLREGKPVIYTLLPMGFMLLVTGWAMLQNLQGYWQAQPRKLPLVAVGGVVLMLAVWLCIEGLLAFRRGLAPVNTEAGGVR